MELNHKSLKADIGDAIIMALYTIFMCIAFIAVVILSPLFLILYLIGKLARYLGAAI